MEYMAMRMNDHMESCERWRNELYDEVFDNIRSNPETSRAFAFMYTDCIYESAAYPISLHWTKAGAYRAMNRYLFDKWQKYNTDPFRKKYAGRGYKVVDQRMQWWGIVEHPIQR